MTSTEKLTGWLSGRLPADWFTAAPDITRDRDEILIVGALPEPTYPDGATDEAKAAAVAGRIRQFREDTRGRRIEIARELESATDQKVSWGVTCAGKQEVFTSLAAPVMTRLRQSERQVLDTLVEAGVARSRSEAVAWCVRLVAEHADTWLTELHAAMEGVRTVRDAGPDLG